MARNKRLTISNIRGGLATAAVLLVLTTPAAVSGWWLYKAVYKHDPRTIMLTAAYQPRAVDSTNQPLKPFKEPIVSVTFDDGWESVYTQAFPVLQRSGIRTTQYVISGEFDSPAYMSVQQLRAMQAAGTQIGDHTVDHADLTTLNADQLKHELKDSQDSLYKLFGVRTQDFTSPYGAYNEYTVKTIGAYFRSQKNAEGDVSSSKDPLQTINVAATFDPLNFPSYSVRRNTKISDLQHMLDETIKYNGWLVLTYHQVDMSGGEFAVTPDAFKAQMELISRSSLRTATVGQVLDALGQTERGHE